MIQLVTPFPFLLDFAFFAPFILRIVVALLLLSFVSAPSTAPVWKKSLITLIGISIFVGIGLQISVLILALFLATSLTTTKASLPFLLTRTETVLLIGICLSLLVTGAGPFSFDLPL